jgi:methylthioribose-1-phosphate isomerase
MRWPDGFCAREICIAFSSGVDIGSREENASGQGVDECVMRVGNRHFRSIWLEQDGWSVSAIDQRRLPHDFAVVRLTTCDATADAIRSMLVRGAPLIGATAAYGVALAMRADPSDAALDRACRTLLATRPTAINLHWALEEMRAVLRTLPPEQRVEAACARASAIAEEDVAINAGIGRNGLALIEGIAAKKQHGERVNVLTHCNAGWLATVDWGTATAPIYLAHDRGHPVHVWVDETRPRNQGASLTAWELGHHGVPHTVIPDNTGGHLMQHGMVDLVIVGTDRATADGDVCNKIGTYLKALAAQDNGVPFYVALPSPTIDFSVHDGIREIPIEQRGPEEVTHITGRTADGRIETVRIVPEGSPVANYGFDVTPARLVTGLITERGVLKPDRAALAAAFPERIAAAAE